MAKRSSPFQFPFSLCIANQFKAEKLKAAMPDAQLEVIRGMNHILKNVEDDDIANSKSYNDPSLPVMSELIDLITRFILKG